MNTETQHKYIFLRTSHIQVSKFRDYEKKIGSYFSFIGLLTVQKAFTNECLKISGYILKICNITQTTHNFQDAYIFYKDGPSVEI